MFDIGFWEIAVIGVIALLVVGPERLPGLARNVGRWVGRMRRYVSHVKQDIEREIHADEVRQLLEKPEGLESIRDIARDTAAVFEDTRKELNEVVNDARSGEQAGAQSTGQSTGQSAGHTDATTGEPPAGESGSDWAAGEASYESRDKLAEATASRAAEEQAPQSLAHEDPVVPSSIANESPDADAEKKSAPQTGVESASTSDFLTDEQRTEQPGKR